MRTLAIETSWRTGSVALFDGGAVVESILAAQREHAKLLMPTIDEMVASAGWTPESIELVAVGIGPGSYTGLRVAVATAKTLAWTLGLPLIGVPTFDAVALNAVDADLADLGATDESKVLVAIDAKRKEVYAGLYTLGDDAERIRDAHVATAEEAAGEIGPGDIVIGDALETYSDQLLATGATAAPEELWRPSAVHLAARGFVLYEEMGPSDTHGLEPLYLRRPPGA